MGTDQVPQSDHARARRWFWLLLVVSILLMGGVYRTTYAEPGLLTGAAFLVLSNLLVAALVQAARVWVALQNVARGGRATPPGTRIGVDSTLTRRSRGARAPLLEQSHRRRPRTTGRS